MPGKGSQPVENEDCHGGLSRRSSLAKAEAYRAKPGKTLHCIEQNRFELRLGTCGGGAESEDPSLLT